MMGAAFPLHVNLQSPQNDPIPAHRCRFMAFATIAFLLLTHTDARCCAAIDWHQATRRRSSTGFWQGHLHGLFNHLLRVLGVAAITFGIGWIKFKTRKHDGSPVRARGRRGLGLTPFLKPHPVVSARSARRRPADVKATLFLPVRLSAGTQYT